VAYDFPASPSVGTLFSPAGGPSWQWNGVGWINVSPAGLIQEAPLDGQNYVRRNGVWVPAPTPSKNRILNGAMQVSQENGSTLGNTNNYYPADQWLSAYNALTSSSVRTASTDPRIGPFYISLGINVAKPSLAATDYSYLAQYFEGLKLADLYWGSPSAKPIVVRFKANCSVPGTYALQLRNADATRSYVAPIALDGPVKEFIVPIPGCTDGTWPVDTGKWGIMGICPAAGANLLAPTPNTWQAGNYLGFVGMSNLATTANQSFSLGQVGLYLDDGSGFPPTWELPDPAQELIACMRYWQKTNGNGGYFSGNVTAGSGYLASRSYVVPMRASPAASGTNANASNFPAASGAIGANTNEWSENRTASVSGPAYFTSIISFNARM
jgi:hypothetical protein